MSAYQCRLAVDDESPVPGRGNQGPHAGRQPGYVILGGGRADFDLEPTVVAKIPISEMDWSPPHRGDDLVSAQEDDPAPGFVVTDTSLRVGVAGRSDLVFEAKPVILDGHVWNLSRGNSRYSRNH